MGDDEITQEADMFAFGTVVIEVGIHTCCGRRVDRWFIQCLIPCLGFYRKEPIQRLQILVHYFKDDEW